MNMPEVYGQVLCNVPAPELVDGGFILPPKVRMLTICWKRLMTTTSARL
jgi:hypothetical protein